MMLCNRTSRYHVAAAAIRGGAQFNPKVAVDSHEMVSYVMHLAEKERDYIFANGKGEFLIT
jgi:xylulose-5-phosphate/fructose-6-phosphate phosphoketolase